MLWAYCRVSSGKQLEGLSMSLQGDEELLNRIARKFHTKLGNRVYADEGRSAYKGEHLKGELGRFLDDLEVGVTSITDEPITPGDVLVIRHLDRLSRLNLADSMDLYNKILKAGIKIYTTMDGRTYSIDDPNDVQAVNNAIVGFAFANANEESKKKSYYIRKNALSRIKQYNDGIRFNQNGKKYPFELGLGSVPFYAKTKGKEKYVVADVEQIKVLSKMVEHYVSGYSLAACSDFLIENGINKTAIQVHNILNTSALIGERRLSVEGQQYILKDYYPPVCSYEQYKKIKERMAYFASKYVPEDRHYRTILCGTNSLICRDCSKSLTPMQTRGYRRYQCRTKECTGFRLGQNHLNRLVLIALQEQFNNEIDSVKEKCRALEDQINALEALIQSFENGSVHQKHERATKKLVEANMLDLVELKTEFSKSSLLVRILDLNESVSWQAFISEMNEKGNNPFRLALRSLIWSLIDKVETRGKYLIGVHFKSGESRYYLVLRQKSSNNCYYSPLTVVTEGQYQNLVGNDPTACLRFVTTKGVKGKQLYELSLDQIINDDMLKELKILSLYGAGWRKLETIKSLDKAINSSSTGLLEWSRASIVTKGVLSNATWDKLKIEDLIPYSNLKFYKMAIRKLNTGIKLLQFVSNKPLVVDELLKTYPTYKVFYFEEVKTNSELVRKGQRCAHVEEIRRNARAGLYD